MKISVITVCYNAEKTVRHTVESFLSQTHADREMLIIDGMSKDRTLEIVRSYQSPLIKIHSEKDNGIYDAMNKGLKLYTGDAVGLLNADDIYHNTNSLALIAQGLSQSPIVTGGTNMVSDHVSGTINRVWQPEAFKLGAFLTGYMPPHPSTYALREVYDQVGGFDTSYTICADYEWMIRAMEIHRFRVLVLDQVLTHMMLGGASTSGLKSSLVNLRETSRARQKWLGSGAIDAAMVAKAWGKMRRMAFG
jgi:glycosyltransferase involved in cell wall biosynthesis